MMYFKLAFLNAKRCIFDYLLYIVTMIILCSIILVSEYIAVIGNVKDGFQTNSLPLLITLISVILVGYINSFIVKQRAKEFANYMLLGMEKKTLIQMVLFEFFIIGISCFMISGLFSMGLCIFITYIALEPAGMIDTQCILYLKSFLYTSLYFFVIEVFTLYFMKRRLSKLEICELMKEKKRNQKEGRIYSYHICKVLFYVSITVLLLMVCGLIILPEDMIMVIISLISIPLLISIFAFYKLLFQFLAVKRQKKTESLYQKDWIYIIAKLTSRSKTNALMNGIYSTCLFFSSMSFICGVFMLHAEFDIWNKESQWWMGFLQINLCIIFLVIYFATLSLQQIIEIRLQAKELQILYYMGESRERLKALMRNQILIKLCIPTWMCFALLAVIIPMVNYKLNIVLPAELRNLCLKAAVEFCLCFLALYVCYYGIVYRHCKL